MAKCKSCSYCQIGDVYAICNLLHTHTANIEDPDLGTQFSKCVKHDEKEEKEACQKQPASTSGKAIKTASAARSAEKN